ncbi:MAG: polyprenyl synthetase family protein [Actinomycetota bacterium]|nr:polyprenyl synthetase family protein [Actinomycetota bacterium]
MNVTKLLGLAYVEEDLARLERRLAEEVRVGDPFLDEVTTHLISAGGKRLRPALLVASATHGAAPASDDTLMGAVAVELVHLASLYHDDVMDEAVLRRNVESVNSRWGNLIAIVAGDFLLARSAEIAATLGAEVAGLLAATLGQLCQGQISEVQTAFQPNRTEEAYLATIAGKTAALMATACRIGALTASLDRANVDALTNFGRHFGMVFQIRDDIMDVIGSPEELGKPAGQDLAEGIYTLPVLRALSDPTVGPELRAILGRPLEQPERDKAREMVGSSTAISSTMAVGRRYAALARDAAASVKVPGLTQGLSAIAMSLLEDIPVAV